MMTNVLAFPSTATITIAARIQTIRDVLEPLGFMIFETDASTPAEPFFEVWAWLECGVDFKLGTPASDPRGVTLEELAQLPWVIAQLMEAQAAEAGEEGPRAG